jgi:hypothetical protein
MVMDVHIRVDLDDEGPVVVKSATGDAVERLIRERRLLERASHPGVISLAGRSPGDPAELRTRYAGEPVARWTGSLPAVAGLGAAVASTLSDLHDLGIVHGRLDATHILIGDDGRARLCGLSHPGGATAADDVAALGAVLGQLVERAPAGRRGVLRRHAQAGGARRALLQVVDRAVDAVPTRRPSARGLAEALLAAVPGARLPSAGHGAGEPQPTGASRPVPASGTAGSERGDEPDTLDRIWAFAGDESDDERWAAALGTGPPDLPTTAGRDDTTQLPMAEIDTPAWPAASADDTVPLPHPTGTRGALDDPWPDATSTPGRSADIQDPHREPADTRTSDDDQAAATPTDRPGDHGRRRVGPAAALRAGDADAARPLERDARPPGDPLDDGRGAVLPGNAGRYGDQPTRDHLPAGGRVPVGQRPPRGRGGRKARRGRRMASAAGLGLVAFATAGATVLGSGGGADAPRPEPSALVCPEPAGPAADVDGDGCPEALAVEGGTVDAGVARWSLGEPGDLATVGDWDCDGEASAALLRPSTGDVFVFSAWADAGEPLTVSATERVDGGVGIRTAAGEQGCQRVVVDLAGGGSTTVEASG